MKRPCLATGIADQIKEFDLCTRFPMNQGPLGRPAESLHSITVTLAVLVAFCCFSLCSCAKPEQRLTPEQPPQPAAPPASEEAKPEDLARVPLARPPEVRQKVDSIFKGAAVLGEAETPYFLAGDFNGDFSQDIAVIIKPAPGKLAEINDELAPWIRDDALAGVLPDPIVKAQNPQAMPRAVFMQDGDLLLAIVHGYGKNGWRDPEAQQTYVVRNAVHGKMGTETSKDAVANNKDMPLPKLRGDVISGTLAGNPGFLYYNGAHYAWYDARHYKPPPPARKAH
jgi:hypothetical protein